MGMRWQGWTVIALLAASPATAQQQQASPMEQAMGAKLVAEISAGVQCTANALSLQKELEAAKARINDLEGQLRSATLKKD